jgi:serine/threonine protein kinase
MSDYNSGSPKKYNKEEKNYTNEKINNRKNKIGDYMIGEKLDEKQFIKIKLGKNITTNEQVIIKIIDKGYLYDKEKNLNHLTSEISILKVLHHKNVIRLYEIREMTTNIYLIMEYCENNCLLNFILENKYNNICDHNTNINNNIDINKNNYYNTMCNNNNNILYSNLPVTNNLNSYKTLYKSKTIKDNKDKDKDKEINNQIKFINSQSNNNNQNNNNNNILGNKRITTRNSIGNSISIRNSIRNSIDGKIFNQININNYNNNPINNNNINLKEKEKINEKFACKLFQDLINGLEYLHNQNITVRNLSASSLFLDSNYNLKISKFNTAKFYKYEKLLKTPVCSLQYSAPEVILGKGYHGLFSDIWSAGVILYFILTGGKLPFYSENDEVTISKINSNDFEIPEFISDSAKDLIRKILIKDCMKRLDIKEIKMHPWFNLNKSNLNMGIDIRKIVIPIEEKIIAKMERLKYNIEKIRNKIVNNIYDQSTSIYYLLLKGYNKDGHISHADLKSNLFIDYINNPENYKKNNNNNNDNDNDNENDNDNDNENVNLKRLNKNIKNDNDISIDKLSEYNIDLSDNDKNNSISCDIKESGNF